MSTAKLWAMISCAMQTKKESQSLQIKLHIMRRQLSTAFITCSHGEIRFLQTKKARKTKKQSKSEESILGIESRSIEEAGIVIGLDSKNF